MEGIRIRGKRSRRRMAASGSVAFVLAVLVLAFVPTMACATVQVRTLLMGEQLRPGSVRGPLAGPLQPQGMVAQPGEEEGFILAIRPDRDTYLSASVASGSSQFLQQWTQIMRVGWVNVTRPSTGIGSSAGRYADPLPPQVPGAGNAGRVLARAGQWSAFLVMVSVPSAQGSGTERGAVSVTDPAGSTLAQVAYSITIAGPAALTPHDASNFKMLFGFNPNWYRALAPAKTAQDQYEQAYRTLWMLARHRASSNVWPRAYPTGDGGYGCSAADGYLKVFDQMPWWADGRPGALPVTLMPNHAVARCTSEGFSIRDERSTANKYDDTVSEPVRAAWFVYRVADHWRTSGIQDQRSYFLNPFDEPSSAQSARDVTRVNKMVHDYAPGVKVLGTTWPMSVANQRVCRTVRGRRVCAIRRGQPTSNAYLRDGRGGDDLDGWVVPYFRLFGFGVTKAQREVGIDRSREVVSRLQQIQRAGGEAWTYDLPLGSRRVPQLDIDAPAPDARALFWLLGREGTNGWFSAVTNRWVNPLSTTQPRNPWEDPLSWVGSNAGRTGTKPGPQAVVSNGWGSLYYPGYRPQLGLTDPLAQPVSSLRLERMRDGVEDVNLMHQYRARFGQARLNAKLRGVFGGLQAGLDLPGNETFPTFNRAGMALRMELIRRQLIAELAQ